MASQHDQSPAAASAHSASAVPACVLVIEDDLGAAERAERWLQREGSDWLTVRQVDRLSTGIAALEAGGIDMVLLKLNLPDSQGLDTLVRVHNIAPHVPVLVVSGLSSDDPVPEMGSLLERGALQHAAERQHWLTRERAARERAELLARASDLLAQSLDYPTTLRQVGELVVESLTSYCTIDLLNEDGSLQRLVATAADPTMGPLMERLRAYPPQPNRPHPAWHALQTGESLLFPEVSEVALAAVARDDEHLALLHSLRERAIMVVPLRARGRMLGILQLLWDASHPFVEVLPLSRAQDEQHDLLLLARALADRAAVAIDNARLYAEAQAALADRDALLASVAHDLRNPLGTIKMAAQMARKDLPLLRPRDQARSNAVARMLAKVDVLTARMDGYIQELVDAAALKQGSHLTLKADLLDVVDVVRTALDNQPEDTPVRLHHTVAALPVVADEARLLRVLDTFFSNARKYSPPESEVLVTLAQEDTPLGAWAVIRVQDHGMGIPAADQPHVFEPYHRARNVRGRVVGTGLGLWGARQIVEQHGGTLTLESQEGVGTTVTVRLPLQATEDGERAGNR